MEAHESENPLNFESVRASWIAKQLKAREASFTKTYDITYVFAEYSTSPTDTRPHSTKWACAPLLRFLLSYLAFSSHFPQSCIN